MANSPQYTCREDLMNGIKREKDTTLKDECPRSEGVQHAPGEERRTATNSPERTKRLGHNCSVVDVSGD